ncbi:MAG: sugar ABC transporter permease [Firmicutes bacterium]|nr:sugar ABC transporter permease [Bacillota bacterium]
MRRGRRFGLSLTSKMSMYGYVFALPFIVGFILFFLYPMVQSVIFSVSDLVIRRGGYDLEYVGLSNYRYALFVDDKYVRVLVETLGKMLGDVGAVLIFSLFAASLLNSRFKGRTLVRVIFLLPVIFGSGVIMRIEEADYRNQVLVMGTEVGTGVFSREALAGFLMQIGIPETMLEYIVNVVYGIPRIIRASAIQILIFLAGFQSIPKSLYESADVEGATRWESFWKITFPLLSPLILTNIVYSTVDFFGSPRNEMIEKIRATAFGGAGYGVSTAMAFMYFALVSFLITVIVVVVSRWVFYHE